MLDVEEGTTHLFFVPFDFSPLEFVSSSSHWNSLLDDLSRFCEEDSRSLFGAACSEPHVFVDCRSKRRNTASIDGWTKSARDSLKDRYLIALRGKRNS